MTKTEILLDSIKTFLESGNEAGATQLLEKYIQSESQTSASGFDELKDLITNNIKAINTDKQMHKLSHSMPAARDKLQYISNETERRTQDTVSRLSRIRSILYSNTANSPNTILEINNHLTKILENQEIQDVGAQVIQKAIILVGNLEEQIIRMSGSDEQIRPTVSNNHQDLAQVDINDLFAAHSD